jgi:DNA-binding SARP family transcriptional activator/TolB-like protein/Flp pilus assembly protein TadD
MPRKASSIEIHLLGAFRVSVDGRVVAERQFTRRKPKQLIKLLALQPNHQLHREQAMELLWPDSDPESAANNLHKAIHMARRALEPSLKSVAESHFILTQGQQVLLRAPGRLWIDVEEFEQQVTAAKGGSDVKAYEEARALYGGELLTEDRYEDWATARREQLENMHRELLLKLAGLYETRGEPQLAIERLQELATNDISNEETHRHLMRLYALTGNKHQALKQYQVCCDALQKELDAEPERQTRELRQQIISGQLAPGPAGIDADGPDSAIQSLAIFPLINSSADPNAEYLSDGITETIINSLSQLPQLRVMARSTVFRYKGQDIDPQEVGRKLGVRAVLTGRVLYRGDALNIQTELVDAWDGTQLWGAQYNRSSSDIFELQEEIAREITEKLRLRLSGTDKGRLAKRYTENTEAYRLYLKGRYFWSKRTAETVKKSLEYFQRAIGKDSNYALAYVGLADSYTKLGDVGVAVLLPREAFSQAKIAAVRALAIDGTLAEAHTSMAHLHMHDYEWLEAEREFKCANELNPNYATTHHWYAYLLLMVGRLDEAMIEIAEALELDPLSLPINADYGDILYFSRHYDQAIEQLRKTLEMDSHFYPARIYLGRVYEEKQMYEESITEFQKARDLSRDIADPLAALGHAYALSGEREKALAMLARLNELSKTSYVSPYGVATVYAGLGEKGKAFEWLRRASAEHAGWVIYLKVDPKLDPLRTDRRFKELLRSVRFL